MFVSARFRTYCQATEEEEKVRQALRFVSGVEDKAIKVTRNKGFHGNEILTLETRVRKGPGLTGFLEKLTQAGMFEALKHEIDVRLDDECMFFLRLNKQEAFRGKLVLDSGMDTIQVKAKVQCFPAKPDKAAEEVKAHLKKIEQRLTRSPN